MSTLSAETVAWQSKPFAELTTTELYALLALRRRVFVVEQTCPYLDADGRDYDAVHVFAPSPSSAREVIACARIFAPGARYEREACLGRVVSEPSLRRTGLGRACVARSIAEIEERYGRVPVRISAQCYLERFYESFGFAPEGERYLEDEIPHVAMLRPARAS